MRAEGLTPFLDGLMARIADYHLASQEIGQKTVDYLPEESRRKTTDLSLPLKGNGFERVLDDIDEFLRQCVRTNNPQFMNPLWGGLNLSAFAGEVIAALTNQSMYTYELSPISTLIEKAIIFRMMEIINIT